MFKVGTWNLCMELYKVSVRNVPGLKLMCFIRGTQ